MKYFQSFLIAALLCTSANADEASDLPRGSYGTDQMKEAQAEATKKGKNLVFLKKDDWGRHHDYVKILSPDFVPLFRRGGDPDWRQHVSPYVVTGMQKYMVFVTTPDMHQVLGFIFNPNFNPTKDDFRKLKKQVDEVASGKAELDYPGDRLVYWPYAPEHYESPGAWPGRFIKINEKKELILSNGGHPTNTKKFPLTYFSRESILLARKLAGLENDPDTEPGPPTAPTPAYGPLENWTLDLVKKEILRARFVQLTGSKKSGVILELENGERKTMSLAYFTPEGRERARELGKMKEEGVPPAAPAPAPIAGPADKPEPVTEQKQPFEDWTANNGKTIQARFISLIGDQITLEMPNGKSYTMPLDRLNESSQKRAESIKAGESE